MILFSILLILCIISGGTLAVLNCFEAKKDSEKNCFLFERSNYTNCVRNRMKRQLTACEYHSYCNTCSCNSCNYSQCNQGHCNDCCNSCCPNFIQCYTTSCCYEQCQNECPRNYECYTECSDNCKLNKMASHHHQHQHHHSEVVEHYNNNNNNNVPISPISTIIHAEKSNSESKKTVIANYTTHINLTNHVHNINEISIPLNLSTVNRNEITIEEADQQLISGSNSASYLNAARDATNDKCCMVIGPKQCVPVKEPPYIHCVHTRARQCGSFCTDKVVHMENKNVCNSVNEYGQPINCRPTTVYIPQPHPLCVYTSTWPFFKCSVKPPEICEKCLGQISQISSCPAQCFSNFPVNPPIPQIPAPSSSSSGFSPCAFSSQGCGGGGGDGLNGFASGNWPGINNGYPAMPFGYPNFYPEQEIPIETNVIPQEFPKFEKHEKTTEKNIQLEEKETDEPDVEVNDAPYAEEIKENPLKIDVKIIDPEDNNNNSTTKNKEKIE